MHRMIKRGANGLAAKTEMEEWNNGQKRITSVFGLRVLG
jgi:hypothetical protein